MVLHAFKLFMGKSALEKWPKMWDPRECTVDFRLLGSRIDTNTDTAVPARSFILAGEPISDAI